MMVDDVRETLERLIRERGSDYASLSRLLGRNAAYMQQFIRRGVPRKLDEDDRRTLARFFGVEEAELGGPATVTLAPAGTSRTRNASVFRAVPRFALVRASAGHGAIETDESMSGPVGFDEHFLRGLSANTSLLSLIRVEGDSMNPTLADGDEIMVDRGDAVGRLRDGIYVLRMDGALNVKRLAINPATRRVAVNSDNKDYSSWPDLHPSQIELIGRVVWVSRRLR